MVQGIRLGFVGMRNIGRGHVRNASKLEGVTVAALVDTDPERLQEAGREFGVETLLDSTDALLARDDIDGVVLAVPNQFHASMTTAALEAGKHVLVEKPMCRSVPEAEAMIAARDRSGKTLMVGMNQRFDPLVAALRQQVADGALGAFQFGRTRWLLHRPFEGLWSRGDWFLSEGESGGGPVADMGVHRLDLALHLLGFPEVASVSAVCFHGIGKAEAEKRGKPYGIEDGGVGLIRFADGGCLELEASYFSNTTSDGRATELRGTKGSLVLEDEAPLKDHESGEATPVPVTPDASAPTSCAEHFVRVLRGEEELSSTPEEGLVSVRILEAFYESARTGEAVRIG